MFRVPETPQRSPGAPPPAERHPSPSSRWGSPGARLPHGYPGHHQQRFHRGSPYSAGSPGTSRGYRNNSPGGFGSGPRGFTGSPVGFRGGPRNFGASPDSSRSFEDSPSGYGGGYRGFGGPSRRRGDGYRQPHSYSPNSAPYFKDSSSGTPVENYYRVSMVQDPWMSLQPVTAAEAKAKRSL